MMKIRYKNKTFNLRISRGGFKIQREGSDRWEYVKKEYIIKLCSLLNATFGYKNQPGRLKLNIALDRREGIPLTKQRPIIWNTAIITNCLFPEQTLIEDGYIVSSDILKTEELEERMKEMLLKEEVVVNVKGKIPEEYISLTEFMEG